jgi:hypothetical protein
VIGTIFVLAFNSTIDILSITDHNFRLLGLLSNEYLGLIAGQILGFYVFVLSKRPYDLFALFNKRPDVKFSMFQYANIQNFEKKITI